MKRILLLVAAGLLPARFLVGATVMADGPVDERIMAFGIVAVAFLVSGVVAGWMTRVWTSGLWLALPAVAVALLLGDQLWIQAGAVGSSVGGACLGALLGAVLVNRRNGTLVRG